MCSLEANWGYAVNASTFLHVSPQESDVVSITPGHFCLTLFNFIYKIYFEGSFVKSVLTHENGENISFYSSDCIITPTYIGVTSVSPFFKLLFNHS